MINHVNKNVDVSLLEARIAEEIEEKLEFGCYLGNVSLCDGNSCSCNVGNVKVCGANIRIC